MKPQDFAKLRYGLFVHYGLYSGLARGEWVMNRERIAPETMRKIAAGFTAEHFDADRICDLAIAGGMRYVVLTTMHHEGFRLYDTKLSDFKSTNSPCGRDLVAEFTVAARARGLKIGLYHSLNNWFDQPDSVAALESAEDYQVFIKSTFDRLEELVTNYDFDVMWYDGWWPFDAEGWQGEAMNAKLRAIKPDLIFNPRNGLPGDFSTPEGHMSAPTPWRPWEGCMTLNDNWGYHAGDQNWKSPMDVIKLLVAAANGRGSLLLNIGPRGDGSIPKVSIEIIEKVGAWLQTNGEAIYPTELFTIDPFRRGTSHRKDITHHGAYTTSGDNLYLVASSWPGASFTICGIQNQVLNVQILGLESDASFKQDGEFLLISGLPKAAPDELPNVIKLTCDGNPELYGHGGMRTPQAPHCRYDPVESDISW